MVEDGQKQEEGNLSGEQLPVQESMPLLSGRPGNPMASILEKSGQEHVSVRNRRDASGDEGRAALIDADLCFFIRDEEDSEEDEESKDH